jgi:pimeloyl-ACP methyl ester carboxylesterase
MVASMRPLLASLLLLVVVGCAPISADRRPSAVMSTPAATPPDVSTTNGRTPATIGPTSSAGTPGTPTATDADREGRVDVGRYSLYLQCRGSGSPIVLFHNGAGGNHRQWDPVFDGIASQTRACRYDLPNTGDSDAFEGIRTAADDVGDLMTLERLGVLRPPYLMVAFSAGSFPAWLYAAEHPRDVSAIVFVDPLLPGYEAAWQQRLAPEARSQRQRERAGENDERYNFTTSEGQVTAAGIPNIPMTLIANDRHIRWESCPQTCEDMTPAEQGLIDTLVSRWPGATAIRIPSPHLVVDHDPDLVRDRILRALATPPPP